MIIIALVLILFFSWLFTIGAVALICLCFGIGFSLPIATGIWLILCVLSAFLKPASNN